MQSPAASNHWPLKRFISEEQLQWLVVFSCQLVFLGFVAGRAIASIGMIVIIAASILYYGLGQTVKCYFAKKELWILSLFFWLVLFTGLYSENKSDWLNWVRIKLPFIALPLAFAPLKKFSPRQITALLYGFILILAISAGVVLIRYFMNFEAITDSFSRGNGIPMPYSHIRYTLMLAFSFFCCIWLFRRKEFLFSPNEKRMLILLAAIAFVALHILSVRSALLALYLGIVFLAAMEAIHHKKIWQSLAVVAAVGALPFIAYKYMPSFHNKIEYMKWDLYQYQEGKANDYSDAMRIISMKIGFDIWKEHPVLGVGAGDLRSETYRHYEVDYPDISKNNWRMPHNQFLWVMASAGTIGLVLFLLAFFYPLAVKSHYKLWILSLLHLILFSSFFTEDTFEEQIGTGFYLVFLLVFMNYLRDE